MANFKKMLDYTDEELSEAIEEAEKVLTSEHFYTLLRGIDAYMEGRKRKQNKSSYGET